MKLRKATVCSVVLERMEGEGGGQSRESCMWSMVMLVSCGGTHVIIISTFFTGVKKLLGWKQIPTPTHGHPPTVHEVCLIKHL